MPVPHGIDVHMATDTKLGRQTKWGANISVNLLRQAYDPILLEPIPERLIKAASVLAEVCVRHLSGAEAMGRESDLRQERP
jgi:hypothetical protein